MKSGINGKKEILAFVVTGCMLLDSDMADFSGRNSKSGFKSI